ncbi:MAG: gliding motility protein GldM [Prevotellaceae bacterium]|jgi:gliding motility-associated protein GldM|nr:gliding motility protein GldM [Prevotellaceae bacterium]
MAGAKNCPETPRQKMIGMMYLVLTAMLALNVSADILRGFTMVNQSLDTTIETTGNRNQLIFDRLKELYDQNKEKVGPWLSKAEEVRKRSDELYNYIQNFKVEMIRIADGRSADPEGKIIESKDNTEAASNYGITHGHGDELKTKIDEFRVFVESQFEANDRDSKDKVEMYNKIFSTEPEEVSTDKAQSVSWVVRHFESMPLSAAVTLLTKYQVDVRSTETELLQYFTSQTDAKDFRVNKIEAKVIPESKNVVQGGQYKAQIVLAAMDTTAKPKIVFSNGVELPRELEGLYVVNCHSVGEQHVSGVLYVTNPITGEEDPYSFNEQYTVVPPSVTIANQDMNVVYMGYNNRISISVPGISSDKITASAPNATMEKTGSGLYICKPKSYEDVVISVTATVDGRTASMGATKFRVRTLPDPTAFLKFKDANGNFILYNPNTSKIRLTRANLDGAVMVAEYADGLLQASFSVASFTMLLDDGRSGYTPSLSNGANLSESQRNSLKKLKSGTRVLFEQIKVVGAKTTTLSYPSIVLP